METVIGHSILRYDTVDSTNTLAREFAGNGEPEGLVLTAEEQTAGRGRMGRKWIVPRGTSLQLSILLRPNLSLANISRLMPMAALALANTLEQQLGLKPVLKWPNDLLLRDRDETLKKVAGVLIESGVQDEKVDYVILGIGLNVNYTMRDYPDLAAFATTLQDIVGQPLDRARLEQDLLAQLNLYYARIQAGESLRDEYKKRLGMLGQVIRVASEGKILQGVAQDVDEEGALILAQGTDRVRLFAGEVTILKENREAA